MSATSNDVVTPNADSVDQQRLAQKRLLEASLFGSEDCTAPKRTRQRETEDPAQTKDRSKSAKNHDVDDSKASKQSTETNGSSHRSQSKTAEPTSSKHPDDGTNRHSKRSHHDDSHHHRSHSKHQKSSHHSSSSTKQSTPPLSAVSSRQSAKDDSDRRKVSPLKLTKSSAAKHSSAIHSVDMKNLFGDDDDDDDDDITDTADDTAAAATVPVKDAVRHKEDHEKPADITKTHTSHSHKKVPDKPSSGKAHPAATASSSGKDKAHTQPAKPESRSLSCSSDRHRQSESETEKRSGDAARSSGKPVSAATKPDSATTAVADSAAVTTEWSKVCQSKSQDESGECAADLTLSDSDSDINDVDVCDSQPENNSHHQSSSDVPPSLLHEAKAANGEYISVLLDLQKRLMSVADDEALERLTTLIEETGKYSITDETFDFDLCRLDIHTVNKLKHFVATTAF